MHRKVLGRGLEALIPPADTATALPEAPRDGTLELPVDEIVANPYQPRLTSTTKPSRSWPHPSELRACFSPSSFAAILGQVAINWWLESVAFEQP
jgi:hypothetical protein